MIANTIKFFLIYYCTTYVFNKIFSTVPHIRIANNIALPIVLTILSCIINLMNKELTYFIPLLLFWCITSHLTSFPKQSFIASIASFTISYSVHILLSFLLTLIMYPLFLGSSNFPFVLLAVVSSSCQIIIIRKLFKIKRFKKGMPFLFIAPFSNTITFLGVFLIASSVYIASARTSTQVQILAFLSTALSLAFLIYWWQSQITKSYRRSLELRELESLRTELQEKNAAMMRVMEENERIRHINHRDNGLITALDYAVTDYLITDFADEETAIARRDELLVEIERIRAGRVSSMNKNVVKAPRYDTSISFLNIFLNHMSKRATDEHVLFSVHIGTELDDFIPHIISDEDLVHLLSDLLENAFIATRDMTGRMVQLQFYKWNKHFVIEVADNGIPFEVESLLNMGISELTTHADTGGSGIGLMHIWKTKEKYGATYHLEEYKTAAPFSKKISLTFDKKNRYSVRTWRKDEILAASKRADLQVYGQDE